MPYEFLNDAETRMNQGAITLGHRSPYDESLAAKAALEAGESDKALSYATDALAMAKRLEADRRQRGFKTPQRHAGISETYFYANFVLGRLAMQNGDIRSAEQYLLASGKTIGSPVLNSYGPNMSLALELLKHGDSQSWQAVLQFIQEIRVFWKIAPEHFDNWSNQIKSGKIPDFMAAGPNLFN